MDFPTSVLITGITGCVGSTLASRLVARGVKTSGLVRAHGSSRASARTSRIAGLKGVRNYQYQSANADELSAILEDAQPQVIVHLAAAGVAPRDRQIGSLLSANVDLTVNLLQAACAANRPYFIHIGSCFEYADSGDNLLDETSPVHPFSLYGATKTASVALAVGLAIELQLRMVVLRLFGVYGPSESSERFIPTVIRNLADGQAMALTPGTQRRDLMMVEDVASALMAAMQNFESLENLSVYNLCTGIATSIRQVGETIAEEMNCPKSLLEWGALPPRSGEPEHIVGNGSRFYAATHWRPAYDLRSGLRRTIEALAPQQPALRRAA